MAIDGTSGVLDNIEHNYSMSLFGKHLPPVLLVNIDGLSIMEVASAKRKDIKFT